MPQFVFKAADPYGKVINGQRAANSKLELADRLSQTGLVLLKAKPVSTSSFLKSFQGIQFGSVKKEEVIEFSNSMGVMLKAGVPLVESLCELREDQGNKYFKNIMDDMIEQVQGGTALNKAFKKHPSAFPELYANIIEIGESTGQLDTVFFNLGRHFKRIDDLNKNVRKAMIYPITVLLVLIAVSVLFLVKVFPALFDMLKEFGDGKLPPLTNFFLQLSTFMQMHWLWVLVGLIGFCMLISFLRRIKTTRYYFDLFEIRLPFIKGFFIQLRMATFARYLSMLQGAGVDILRSMDLATQSVNNLVIERILKHARQGIEEGKSLSQTLRGGSLIPNMVVRMIGIGESSGTLPEQLEFVANYYDEGLERRIALALTVIEPLLILVLATMALSLVAALFQPMYGLFTNVTG